MAGEGACVAGGCAMHVPCMAGGMHGRGACVVGVAYEVRACMAGGHAWHMVNERAVRILMECILVSHCMSEFYFIRTNLRSNGYSYRIYFSFEISHPRKHFCTQINIYVYLETNTKASNDLSRSQPGPRDRVFPLYTQLAILVFVLL